MLWTSQRARAFDWLQWAACLEGARDIIRDGVHRVYAVRWEHDGNAESVFCYGNGRFGNLPPCRARYPGAGGGTSVKMYRQSDWRTEPMLSVAPGASQSWLALRNQVSWGSD